jgi:hypothetical protein
MFFHRKNEIFEAPKTCDKSRFPMPARRNDPGWKSDNGMTG